MDLNFAKVINFFRFHDECLHLILKKEVDFIAGISFEIIFLTFLKNYCFYSLKLS